jgi:Flp pilus assembly protein TadG
MMGRLRMARSIRLVRTLGASERGAAAVEAAFILPLLLLLTIGGLEIGRALWFHGSIRHAVQETARYAVVHGYASGAAVTETQLQTMLTNLADLPGTSTPLVNFDPDNRPGSEVEVSMQHNYVPITGFVFGLSGFTLSSKTVMTIVR